MLNLTRAFQLLPTEQAYLNTLMNPSKTDHESWSAYKDDEEMKRFKARLKSELLDIQDDKCVYCMQTIDTRTAYDGDREHFANKNRYPEYTFEPYNLLLACRTCNNPLKGQTNTIENQNNRYTDCDFSMVHPIIDNVDDHIGFNQGSIIFAITDKGLRTIELFKLDDTYLNREREKELLYVNREEQGLVEEDNNILDLINAAVNYNPFG
jgi:uncharacterized protein (TIGR02646 family)